MKPVGYLKSPLSLILYAQSVKVIKELEQLIQDN